MSAFDTERCQAALTTKRFGRSFVALAATESTMDDARVAAEEGAPEGHVVLADHQRSGRGSHGRVWSSPPESDLYFSLVVRPTLSLADLPPLTLAIGLGVAQALSETLDETAPAVLAPDVRIKWPNDVFVNGEKCAGILVETRSLGAHATAVIVGVGVNVNRQTFDPTLAAESTSLGLVVGASVDREALLAKLLGALEQQVERFLDAGPAVLARDVEARLLYRGQRVHIDAQSGLLAGVDPDGALRICDDEGVTRRVLSGRLRPA